MEQQTTLRTFTIMVYNSNGTHWFRSKDELPAALREKLEETLQSSNSATILLADRNGREELAKALRGTPSALSSRYSPKPLPPGPILEQPLAVTSSAARIRRKEGIGLVPMTKGIAIGFTLLLLSVIAIFAIKILAP